MIFQANENAGYSVLDRHLFRSKIVGPNAEISEVLDGEPSGPSEIGELSLRANVNVVKDGIRWRDLAVAVVPSKLGQLEDVECGISIITEQFLADPLTLSPALSPTRRHGHNWILPDAAWIGTYSAFV